jgi:hypothetical protein
MLLDLIDMVSGMISKLMPWDLMLMKMFVLKMIELESSLVTQHIPWEDMD